MPAVPPLPWRTCCAPAPISALSPASSSKPWTTRARRRPIKVKGFAEPLRCYKVLGLYDDLVAKGSVIREEQDGFKLLLDLNKHDRAEAIAALQAVVDRLKE
jgi:hypothetical protein